jgi:DNA-binding transcriptional MocR family regulator
MTGVARPKTAIAYKAISLVGGISKSARRTAGGLIDHYNPKTGRCDPSVGRLATMLGIDRATVLRATAELEAAGLFIKTSHGGHSNCADYRPQWDFFEEIVADWDRRMIAGDPPDKVAKLRR